MISVCCCSLNAKYDTGIFVEALQAHNPGFDFEICITHDDRSNDGSSEYFEQFTKRFSNVKIVTHSWQQTVDYMSAALSMYKKKGIFKRPLIEAMEGNLSRYKRGELVDPAKGFLWQSSGILYNKAVAASSGDIIIVTPGDFMYLFALEELQNFVKSHTTNGHFYASLPAVWARVTNLDKTWLSNHVSNVHAGKSYNPRFRWDSPEVFRDYLRYPPKLEEFIVPDFRRNKLISLEDNSCIRHLRRFTTDVSIAGGVQMNPAFHGYHVMTRKTFDQIGGFTEEWIHRAFPDDKMTRLGRKYGPGTVPAHFSVAWCGQGEISPCRGPGYKSGWKDFAVDEWDDKHPIFPRVRRVYLYSDVIEPSYMTYLVSTNLNTNSSPIRIAT